MQKSAWWTLVCLGITAAGAVHGGCGDAGGSSSSGLPAPTGVTAISDHSTRILVTWEDVTGADRYRLYWATSPGVTKLTGIPIEVEGQRYYHYVTVGPTYYYVVTAVIGGRESAESPEAFTTPLGHPTGFAAVAGPSQVMLDWDLVAGATTYNLYWDVSWTGVGGAKGHLIPDVLPPYLHAPLPNGTTYYYVVAATDPAGGGAASSESIKASATPCDEGILDSSLRGRGFVLHDPGSGEDVGFDVALDAFGRIVVAGGTNYLATHGSAMLVWRFNSDGTLDSSFNGQGWLCETQPGPGVQRGNAVVLDGAGRILVVGETVNEMVIWRYWPNGLRDTTFNGQGWVAHDAAVGWAAGFGIALDAAENILVTGCSQMLCNGDMVVWRYDSSGILDPTFNGQGWLVHGDMDGVDGRNSGEDIILDTVGRILVTGWSTGANFSDMAIWRFNADGTIDTSFNGQGWLMHDNAAGGTFEDKGRDIALDGSDRILVAGESADTSLTVDSVAWRINSDGTLDTTFAGRGWVVGQANAQGMYERAGNGIALDASGRVLVAGRKYESMGVWRYLSDGTPDVAFGCRGWVSHQTGSNRSHVGYGIALDSVGRILVSGTDGRQRMALWRIEG